MTRPLAALALALSAFFAVLATPALAWNSAGHMVNGALTCITLKKESPVTLNRVVTILKAHPEYEGKWAKQIADQDAEDDKNLLLCMLAAR